MSDAVVAWLFAAAIWAGAQNALAGGGSFITLAVLVFSGMDARTANLTSTVALFPGQFATGYLGRRMMSGGALPDTEAPGAPAAGVGGVSIRALVGLSLLGGAAGAGLLLVTPTDVFEAMLPWLILLATGVFAWGSFRTPAGGAGLGRGATVAAQAAIAVYGGFFGGGIGFLMLAWLTMARVPVRMAGALKNVLAAAMNAAAVVIFAASGTVAWRAGAVLCAGALLGGYAGVALLRRSPERVLRLGVIGVGVALTAALFWRRWG